MSFLSRFDEFHEQAAAATGLSDFGDSDYVDPMTRLLTDYDRHSHFNALGEQMLGASVVGILAGRLVAEQGFKSAPQETSPTIERPLIIVGLMRTGSTALHRLLARDPDLQWLPPWLASSPMPRPPRASWSAQPSYQATAIALDQMYALNPRIKQLHPMLVDEPDECRFGMDQTFWSPGLACPASVPDYARWVMSDGASVAYRRYRRILGLVGHGDSRRWLLKDPSHLWQLGALLDTFPDAHVVYTHRDPPGAITSLASLIYELRRLREPELSASLHGREELGLWGGAVEAAEQVRAQRDPAQFFDLHMKELKNDPVGSAERIYHHFKLPIGESTRQAWVDHAAAASRSEPHTHICKPEDFGLSVERIRSATPRYQQRYDSLYAERL